MTMNEEQKQLEPTGNLPTKTINLEVSLSLIALAAIISAAVIGTHAAINYVNILQGVH